MPKKKNKAKENKNVESPIDRFAAIDTILEIFNENRQLFKAKMESEFKSDPARFYRKYIEPIQPKEVGQEDKDKKIVVGFNFTEITKESLKELRGGNGD